MPIIKSAIKRARISERRHARNIQVRSKVHTKIKKVRDLISQKKKKEAVEILPLVYREIDLAAKKNVIEKNNASRKKSRIASQIAAIE